MTPGGGALGLALGRGFPSVFGSLLQYRSLAPSVPARVGFGLPQGWLSRIVAQLAPPSARSLKSSLCAARPVHRNRKSDKMVGSLRGPSRTCSGYTQAR